MVTDEPLVTIVVVMRERFSLIERTLASIAANTSAPYRLVSVVGGAPAYAEAFLRKTSAERGYELILHDEPLSPPAARNLGFARAATRYVAFLDNDIVVAPGWLEALVACAEESGADIVGPLCLIGDPEDGIGHSAGGTLEFVPCDGGRELVARHLLANVDLKTRPVPRARERRGFVESHCLLVRRALFEHIGPWDEELPSQFDYIDLGLGVQQDGGSVWFEPAALISYLAFEEFTVGDLEYFALRWSDDWNKRSTARFAEKWAIARDTPVFTTNAAFAGQHQTTCRLLRTSDPPAAPIDLDAHGFAQTNVQLLNQMRSARYPDRDLEDVRAAYEAASVLFAGRFRPSGKTFLAHLVGTASVLAAYGAHAPLVTAGLLHASYTRGGFPGESGRDYDAQRCWLRSRVGTLAEAIVHEYRRLDRSWINHVVETDIDRLPVNVAYAIVLRIANLIEERLDHQFAYCTSVELDQQGIAEHLAQWGTIYDQVATRLHAREMLSAALDLAARVEPTGFPPGLRSSHTQDFVVDPTSGTSNPITPTALPNSPRSQPGPDGSAFAFPRRLALGPGLLRIEPDAFAALNGGEVTRDGDTLLVACDPQQWAYSAGCELEDTALQGRGVVRITVAIETGELGVGVLVKGSSTDFAAPEHIHGPTDGPIELLAPVTALEECGSIVLRSSAPPGVITRARLMEVVIHAPPSDWSGSPFAGSEPGSRTRAIVRHFRAAFRAQRGRKRPEHLR